MFLSIEFIFLFLPFAILTFSLLKKKSSNWAACFLLISSWVLLYILDARSFYVLVISIAINYATTWCMRYFEREVIKKGILFFGISFNIAIMLFYKFGVGSLPSVLSGESESHLEHGSWIIPIGISFYSLVQISYLVESYRLKLSQQFLSYASAISFFPSIFAGPIINYKDAHAQFNCIGNQMVPMALISQGLCLFCLGFAKKVLLADPIAIFTSQVFQQYQENALTIYEVVGVVWGFFVQLYFEFSGYSDMAIGLALCFGIHLPINFNSPFKARSIGDFISRWHISLLEFNKTYVFFPVSNVIRKDLLKQSRHKHLLSWIISTLLIYLSLGIWHSPTWQYLLINTVVGVLVVLFQILPMVPGAFRIKWPVLVRRGFLLVLAALAATGLKLESVESYKTLITSAVWDIPSRNDSFALFKTLLFEPISPIFPSVTRAVSLLQFGSLSVPYVPLLVAASLIAFIGPNTMELFGVIKRKDGRNTPLSKRTYLVLGIASGVLLAMFLARSLSIAYEQNNVYGQF